MKLLVHDFWREKTSKTKLKINSISIKEYEDVIPQGNRTS